MDTFEQALCEINNAHRNELNETAEENETYISNYAKNISRQDIQVSIPEDDKDFRGVLLDLRRSIAVKKREIYLDSFDHLDENIFNSTETKVVNETDEVKSTNSSEKEVAIPKLDKFVYVLSLRVIENLNLKCWNGQIYCYIPREGRFRKISERELTILIRTGMEKNIQIMLSRNVISEIAERIQTEPTIQVEDEYFNSLTNMINVSNGVLSLTTGKLHRHSPKYRFTHLIHAEYLEHPPKGHMFRKFINSCTQGDKSKERHLQEIVGYLLSETYSAKKALFFIGVPHSGKSMFLRVISKLIGPEDVAHVPLHRLSQRFVMAHMSDKKLNISSELTDDALSNLEIFKSITGNDDLVAEFKGKDHFTYKSRIKLVFAGNNMPSMKKIEKTSAFFDRLTFILSWAVEGIKRLIENNFVFSECDESRTFKYKYVLEQNHIIDFIKSNCTVEKSSKVHSKVLFDAYQIYCHENCLISNCRERFFAEIANWDVKKRKFRLNGSKPLWGYVGMTVNSPLIKLHQ